MDATLRRIRDIQAQMEVTADRTSAVIHRQGEEIGAIALSAESVERTTSISARIVRGLESWSGRIRNFFDTPSSVASGSEAAAVQSQTSMERRSKTEGEEEDALDEISASLGRLKERSLMVSSEIRRQNEQLESSVMPSVDRSVNVLQSQQKRIGR
jgi:hypothetical protein